MDCKTALRMLEVCRPAGDDLSDPELALAAAHIEECSECLSHVRARQAFDASVAAAMQAVFVPHELRGRIDVRLHRAANRRRILRLVAWSAAAAAVFLMAGSLYFWPHSNQSPIEIDWKSLSDVAILDGSEISDFQAVPAGLNDAPSVRSWTSNKLNRLKLPVSLPAAWRSSLVGIGMSTIGGRGVAVFRFQDDRGESEIVALPHDRFHITNPRKGTQLVGYTRNLVVIAWAEQDTTYVAVLKGWAPEDWKPLVRPANNLTWRMPYRWSFG